MKFKVIQSNHHPIINDRDNRFESATEAEIYFYEKITEIKELLEKDDSGDLEFIKYQVAKILSS